MNNELPHGKAQTEEYATNTNTNECKKMEAVLPKYKLFELCLMK